MAERLDLGELEALLAAATPGPWEIVHSHLAKHGRAAFNPWLRIMIGTPKPEGARPDQITGHFVAKVEDYAPTEEAEATPRANADLIVALRNAAPELIRRLREAERCSTCNPGEDSGLCFEHAEELAEDADRSREHWDTEHTEGLKLVHELHAAEQRVTEAEDLLKRYDKTVGYLFSRDRHGGRGYGSVREDYQTFLTPSTPRESAEAAYSVVPACGQRAPRLAEGFGPCTQPYQHRGDCVHPPPSVVPAGRPERCNECEGRGSVWHVENRCGACGGSGTV